MKLINDEHRKMSESVNAFIEWRNERQLDKQLTTVSNIFQNDRRPEDSTTCGNLISVDFYPSDDDDDFTTVRSTRTAKKSFAREIPQTGADENPLVMARVPIELNTNNNRVLVADVGSTASGHCKHDFDLPANVERTNCHDQPDAYNDNTGEGSDFGGGFVFDTNNSEPDVGLKDNDATLSCPRLSEQTATVITRASPKSPERNETNDFTTPGLADHENQSSARVIRDAVNTDANDLNTAQYIIPDNNAVAGGDHNYERDSSADPLTDSCSSSDESFASVWLYQWFRSYGDKTLNVPKTKTACCIL